jgi:hypothetical protein
MEPRLERRADAATFVFDVVSCGAWVASGVSA